MRHCSFFLHLFFIFFFCLVLREQKKKYNALHSGDYRKKIQFNEVKLGTIEGGSVVAENSNLKKLASEQFNFDQIGSSLKNSSQCLNALQDKSVPLGTTLALQKQLARQYF